jgi:hypothetical protein
MLFGYPELYCIPGKKPNLIMEYDLFNVLLIWFVRIVLRIFVSMFIKEIIYIFAVSFSSFSIGVILESSNELDNIPSLSMSWNNLSSIGVILV